MYFQQCLSSSLTVPASGTRQDHRTVAAEVLDVPKFLSLVLGTFQIEGVQSHIYVPQGMPKARSSSSRSS